MKMFLWIVVCVITVLIVGLAYIRFAPSDAAQWHVPITADADKTMEGGAIRVLDATEDSLAQADAAMRALPRTEHLAGSVEEGRITYVTRSFWMNFPDYTTVEVSDGKLRMLARLRFGRSDFGVNARRLDGLVSSLQAGG